MTTDGTESTGWADRGSLFDRPDVSPSDHQRKLWDGRRSGQVAAEPKEDGETR